MAITLVEAAKLSTDMLQRGVIEVFARTSPVLERLPFADIEGNAYRYNVESALPGIAFRAVNEAYVESTGVVNPEVETLVIGGGEVDVDRFIVQTRSNVNDVRAVHTSLKTKALSLAITKTFFDGDAAANPKEFDGLNVRLGSGSQVLPVSAGGALTEDLLTELIDLVEGGPDVLFMSKAMRRELEKLARDNTQISYGTDGFGRRITMYLGVPIGIIEKDQSGNEILDFDEDPGDGNSDTGSIYAVRFGEEEALWGIQNGAISVRDLGELETKPVFRTRIEWYLGLVLGHPRAAARLSAITVAA